MRNPLVAYFLDDPSPTQPTAAGPGTLRKQIVLALRVQRHEDLHHMDDAKHTTEPDMPRQQLQSLLRQLAAAWQTWEEAKAAVQAAVPELDDETLRQYAAGELPLQLLDKVREE